MPAPGFPSQNPARNTPGVRPPTSGGTLLEWLKWRFPSVATQVEGIKHDTREDYKSADYAKQHPGKTGRTP